MVRTRLASLALLNWRGLFFQSFELDRAITALEGENGAGKTTVMIGVFVALLPDLRLLQFRNVSEAGAGDNDRGIYGRLGEKGPSYSVLDVRTANNNRILAGVQLLRRAEPKLELKTFVMRNLDPDLSLEELLLIREGELERVPELAELRQQVGRFGVRLEVFDTVGGYASSLFDLGIMPMRMEAHGDRDKFNRMLQTSMYGGLSSSIQRGLRDYLLVEDPNLCNHVARMRENLDACRVTRQEIQLARSKYELINGLYRAGFRLFEAAFHGTRLRAASYRQAADAARLEHGQCLRHWREQRQREGELAGRQERLRAALDQGREEVADATALWERCRRAREIVRQIEEQTPHREAAEETLAQRRRAREQAEQMVLQAEEKRDCLLAEKEEIANSLADAQHAWETVNRKVGLYRQALRSLADARRALPDRQLTEANASHVLSECDTAWDGALRLQARAQRALDAAAARRERFQRVLNALRRVAGADVQAGEAAEAARLCLREFQDMERALAEAVDLPRKIQLAQDHARRQQLLRRKVEELAGRIGVAMADAEALRQTLETQRQARNALAQGIDTIRQQLLEINARVAAIEPQLPRLEKDLAAWGDAQERTQTLLAWFSQSCDTQGAVEALKERLQRQEQDHQEAIRGQNGIRTRLFEQVAALEYQGGHLDESLIALRDRVEGALLVELYDDVPETQAAAIEARLGPLHGAILVEDVPRAAARIATEAERPDTVWLVQSGQFTEVPEGTPFQDSVLVTMGNAWRLSREPRHPVVGRAAREREIARLRQEAETVAETLGNLFAERKWVQQGLAIVEELYRYWDWIGAPNPQPKLERLRRQRDALQAEARQRETELQALEADHRRVSDWVAELEGCAPDAALLDDQDWYEQLKALRRRREQVESFRRRLAQHRQDLEQVRDGLVDLETPPPSEDDLAQRRAELERSEAELDYWQKGRRLLHDLVAQLPYFAHQDQEPLLEESRSLLADLRERQREVDTRFTAARAELQGLQQGLDSARAQYNQADGHYQALHQRVLEWQRTLEESGEDGTEESLGEARQLLDEAHRALSQAEREERENQNELIRAEEAVKAAWSRVESARDRRRIELRELRPHWRSWIELRRETGREGLLDKVMGPAIAADYEQRGAPNAFGDAALALGELVTLLRDAEQGEALLRTVEDIRNTREQDLRRGYLNLQIWVAVLHFLEQSIPRDIAQADDPDTALRQIESHLARLQDRLLQQEQELRSRSDTVANSIATRIRREEGQIRRLNKGLASAHFGSIEAVRIRLERVDSMQRLLERMRDEPDLFSQDLSLEEAMAQLYGQLGGGQVRGDQLLDYRQYVRMAVEVRRLGRERWELAKPTALSTGESIGVGAAVLMVILDAWEQQATLLRGKRGGGSLRFLFLDEAARLSQNSLLTLAEFCDRMNMQLLVAAPAADRARRGTTYRLTRRVNEAGAEEVIVRGRRLLDTATVV